MGSDDASLKGGQTLSKWQAGRLLVRTYEGEERGGRVDQIGGGHSVRHYSSGDGKDCDRNLATIQVTGKNCVGKRHGHWLLARIWELSLEKARSYESPSPSVTNSFLWLSHQRQHSEAYLYCTRR